MKLSLFAQRHRWLVLGTALGVLGPGTGSRVVGQAPHAPPAHASHNEIWKSSDIGPLVARLENEEREIYRHRELLAAVVGPLPGSVIADVGAGSGFMAEVFARLVGEEGRVIAVDINPTMMEHLANRAREAGLNNLETRVCPEASANLDPNSVDVVFICDTYHHFAHPAGTMGSIHRALKPGGELVLVELIRDEDSPAWVHRAVRADRKTFIEEISQFGFRLTHSHSIPQLSRNYILRFRKR